MNRTTALAAAFAAMHFLPAVYAQVPGRPDQAQQAVSRAQAEARQRAQQEAAVQAQQAQAQQQAAAQRQQAAAQTQQRAQQAQSRVQMQADIMRAARIAQQAAAMSRQRADVSRQPPIAADNARRAANIAAGSRIRTAGNVPETRRIGAEVAAANRERVKTIRQTRFSDTPADERVGANGLASFPPGLSERDVQIFDTIFGQFNPLRRRDRDSPSTEVADAPRPPDTLPTAPTAPTAPAEAAPVEASPNQTPPAEAQQSTDVPVRRGRPEFASNIEDFTTRLRAAARNRRAEISEMRDRALVAGDAPGLLRAHRAEQALNAFVAAQAKVRANTADTPATPAILSREIGGTTTTSEAPTTTSEAPTATSDP